MVRRKRYLGRVYCFFSLEKKAKKKKPLQFTKQFWKQLIINQNNITFVYLTVLNVLVRWDSRSCDKMSNQ
jgi:hypothetical protein